LFITIFIFLFTTDLFSQESPWAGTTITVSGAGVVSCNDVYEFMDDFENHNVYLSNFPNGDILIFFNDSKWLIARIDTSVTPPWPVLNTYYYNDAQTSNPPGTGWYSVAPDGIDPAPTLSGNGIEPGTAGVDIGTQIPEEMTLYPAYPNPFNMETGISYYLTDNTYVKLSVVNIMGCTVRELFRNTQLAGSYNIFWNGKDANGIFVSDGIYFIVLRTTNNMKIQKVLLLKE
jgi:hypothetical protein